VQGNYLDYKADLVESTTDKRVLFFHAPWCSQCKELDESIKNGKIPGGVTIFKTDYDSNQKLRQQYGVTLQTTLVLLDENGGLAKKYVSYEEPNLEALIKNLLQ
jgi:thioredoxin-like negative regulator of GroEL